MLISHVFVEALLAVTAAAVRGRRFRRQNGPTDPGIPSDCTFWETSENKDQDCAYLEDLWELDHETFVEYNPTVKSDCSGIQVGHAYCVEVNNGLPRDEEPPKVTTTKKTVPEPTQDPKPSPTQEGLIDSCTSFYKAKKGDNCPKIIAEYKTFDVDTFIEWNPAVESDCSGIWANTWYCVGVPGTPTSPPTKTAATSTKPTGPAKPSTTQDGLIDSCTSFHQAGKGETCPKILSTYGKSHFLIIHGASLTIAVFLGTFDFDTFFKWNPAVGDDCSGIWAGYYYCVGVPGTPTAAPTKTMMTSTTPKPTGPSKPSTTQEGLIDTCVSFHQAGKGETCAKIVSNFGTFDSDTFFEWNPAVGKDCDGIWAGYYYCVGVPGTPTVKPSATSPKPTATGGGQTPSPIQEGLAKNCNKFHQITSTTTCASIERYYNLPLDQLVAWNPAVEKSCSGLWVGYWVCVSVEGYKPTTTTAATATTTKPANGISTPSPIQGNMVKNCEKFHQIQSTTTCTSIENYYNLPFDTFYSWNPAVGSKCTSLLTGYWVCVGAVGWKPPTKTTTKGSTPTKAPSNGITTPLPIQPKMVGNCNKFHMVAKTTTCSSIENYYKISLVDFGKWNPAVGSNCAGLWAGYNVCVGVIGGSPTKPSNGIETPSPIQPKMALNDCFDLILSCFQRYVETKPCLIVRFQVLAHLPMEKDECNSAVGMGCSFQRGRRTSKALPGLKVTLDIEMTSRSLSLHQEIHRIEAQAAYLSYETQQLGGNTKIRVKPFGDATQIARIEQGLGTQSDTSDDIMIRNYSGFACDTSGDKDARNVYLIKP
ncbi:uncharacterized protein FIESC28_01057 [Fusarium coffeatum]|uniref:LysM domain-containing protein n=1 Tax=Fusarium coffeatum TaxID=231269 RepID=A0A366SBY0_9HYPO|nr:uncharacterized protein FIESC28_01057 [Fusarium coffeatum]RBR26166.1 hypothetical protein FIESC28_01057 [Fusarium coffeatum]